MFLEFVCFFMVGLVDMHSFGRAGVGGLRRNSAECEMFSVCLCVEKS